MRRTNVIRAAALGAASLLGGLIALGGVTLTGDLGGGTTTVVRTSAAPTPAAPVADDGRLTVFVPSVPTPLAGAVYVLRPERVHILDVPFTQAVRSISRWGSGSRDLVAAMRKP